MKRWIVALAVVCVLMTGCTAQEGSEAEGGEEVGTEAMLGPADGHDLPATDIERVQVGQTAPDFSLASLAGPTVTLSSFRGSKNVVLVFYRGHW